MALFRVWVTACGFELHRKVLHKVDAFVFEVACVYTILPKTFVKIVSSLGVRCRDLH